MKQFKIQHLIHWTRIACILVTNQRILTLRVSLKRRDARDSAGTPNVEIGRNGGKVHGDRMWI